MPQRSWTSSRRRPSSFYYSSGLYFSSRMNHTVTKWLKMIGFLNSWKSLFGVKPKFFWIHKLNKIYAMYAPLLNFIKDFMLMSSQVKFFMVFTKVHQAKELANLFKKTFTILDSKCNLWSSLYLGSRKRRNLAVSLFILYRLLLLWTSWFACMSNVHFDFMSCIRIWKKQKGFDLTFPSNLDPSYLDFTSALFESLERNF